MKEPLKRASTFFLKFVIIAIGIAVLILCGFMFPAMWQAKLWLVPEFSVVLYPAVIGIYLTTLPFYFALFQSFKLLHYIDRNEAFSKKSASALRAIKYSAVAMTVLYLAAMPTVVTFADLDDAPGAILIGMAIACSPLIVGTFAAVLQKLVESAVAMKTDQDLTI